MCCFVTGPCGERCGDGCEVKRTKSVVLGEMSVLENGRWMGGSVVEWTGLKWDGERRCGGGC